LNDPVKRDPKEIRNGKKWLRPSVTNGINFQATKNYTSKKCIKSEWRKEVKSLRNTKDLSKRKNPPLPGPDSSKRDTQSTLKNTPTTPPRKSQDLSAAIGETFQKKKKLNLKNNTKRKRPSTKPNKTTKAESMSIRQESLSLKRIWTKKKKKLWRSLVSLNRLWKNKNFWKKPKKDKRKPLKVNKEKDSKTKKLKNKNKRTPKKRKRPRKNLKSKRKKSYKNKNKNFKKKNSKPKLLKKPNLLPLKLQLLKLQ
jgi:hypothetical protein